jgi:hypothetical protein
MKLVAGLKTCFFLLVCAFAMLFFADFSLAQNTVNADLKKKEIKIGEQTSLDFSLIVPAGAKIQFPVIGDSIAPSVEVVSRGKIDTQQVNQNASWKISRSYVLTAFDSGFFPIPPFRFTVNGDSSWESAATLLTVKTVAVDTAAAFKAIKQPLDAPWTIAEIYREISIAAAVLLALKAVIFWWRKRKPAPQKSFVVKVPVIPAHVIAIKALQDLKEQQLWQKGNVKLYHVLLSEIARQYLFNRFGFHAPEKTTDEIVFSLSGLQISARESSAFIESLRISDLVKFAKANPMAGDHEFCWNSIMEFVQQTKDTDSLDEVKEVGHE